MVLFERPLTPPAGPWKGQYHMFYGSRVEDIVDGLPKYLGKQGEQAVDDQGNPKRDEEKSDKENEAEEKAERQAKKQKREE